MSKPNLKPCPLCGSRAMMHSGWKEDGDAFAMIFCIRRSMSDGCASVWVERSDLKTAEMDAMNMWNRRAS